MANLLIDEGSVTVALTPVEKVEALHGDVVLPRSCVRDVRVVQDVHRGLRITEPQRRRFVELYVAAADAAGLPDDPPFRAALRSHVEFGSEVAMQNSHARTDDELHPLRAVPLWQWPTAESP